MMGRFQPSPGPFLKWAGGKRQLLPELLGAVDAAGPFRRYHEPFLGGGALFFALARAGRLKGRSYLADGNQRLIDAYLGVRDHVDAVIALLHAHREKHSEGHFYRVRKRLPRGLPERAARIIYLNRTGFNGLYRENSKGRFNVPFGRYKNPKICNDENLRAVAAVLRGVHIDARDFRDALRLPRKGDLVYLDPPYIPLPRKPSFTSYGAEGFDLDAQRELAEIALKLARRGVKVVASNSMTELTRELYRDFNLYEVMALRVVNSNAERRGKISEALITSFPLERTGRRAGAPSGPPVLKKRAGLKSNGQIERTPAVQWLRENNYADVADLIDEVVAGWQREGKQTRRNWWDILAGDTRGNPRVVAGKAFPVLRVAQARQGVPVTESALSRARREEAPAIRITGRWPKGQVAAPQASRPIRRAR